MQGEEVQGEEVQGESDVRPRKCRKEDVKREFIVLKKIRLVV